MNYENACRTCLTNEESMISVFNIENIAEKLSYIDMLKECASITVTNHDNLPKVICIKCAKMIKDCYTFKKQCHKVEQELYSYLNNFDDERQFYENEALETTASGQSPTNTYEYKEFLNIEDTKIEPYIEDNTNNTIKTSIFEDDESNDVCNKSDITKDNLRKLLRNSNDDRKKYTCEICGKSYNIIGGLNNHMLLHGHNCIQCFRTFDSEEKLNEHRNEHKDQNNFVCKDCGKEFAKKRSLILHKKTHTGERSCLCPICGLAFALQTNLNTHLRIHSGKNPYKCEVCSKTFAQRSSHQSHMITHNKQRNHICSVCNKAFARKYSLQRHMYSHTGERKYPCRLCGKRFLSSNESKNHFLIHTNERNYQCQYCHKAFLRNSKLIEHVRIHTGERPHKCNICGRGFIQPHVLRSHMKTHNKKCENKNEIK